MILLIKQYIKAIKNCSQCIVHSRMVNDLLTQELVTLIYLSYETKQYIIMK